MTEGIQGPIGIRTLGTGDTARWDDYVADCPEAGFFHRAGWKSVIEQAFGHDCYFMYAEGEGRIRGVLPLVHVKSLLFGNSLISTGFTVGGGTAADDEAVRAALDGEALALALRLDVDCLEYRSGEMRHPDWAHNTDLYAVFRKPIGPDSEQDMLAIPRKQRAMVRKGIKANLTSVLDRDVDRLHDIYATSVRNLGTPVYPKRYFRLLMDAFGPDIDIVTVLNGDRAVASVMNFYFRDTVLPYYGGGLPAARAVAGNDFMYWEVMRRAVERGYRAFDFGRSKRGTGAFAFKKNWGFEPAPLIYEFKLCKLDAIPEVNPLNPKYRLLIAAWKRLPVPLAKLIGPPIVRCLG